MLRRGIRVCEFVSLTQISLQADLHVKNSDGMSALDLAQEKSHVDLVTFLEKVAYKGPIKWD